MKKIKRQKLRQMLRKSQPNFQHYVKKIEAQEKKWFSYKKTYRRGICKSFV